MSIEKKNPLKQGLKPEYKISKWRVLIDWKEESIKTRIETKLNYIVCKNLANWKEESIKTRIETCCAGGAEWEYSYWKEESIKTRIET